MFTLESNKQKMYYSLYLGSVPIYEYDDDGNVKYTEVGGQYVPVETGTKRIGYTVPAEFYANIAFGSNQTSDKEFGVDLSSYDASIIANANELPLDEKAIVWVESEPEYEDKKQEIVKAESADYDVVSVKPSLNAQKFLLKHKTK